MKELNMQLYVVGKFIRAIFFGTALMMAIILNIRNIDSVAGGDVMLWILASVLGELVIAYVRRATRSIDPVKTDMVIMCTFYPFLANMLTLPKKGTLFQAPGIQAVAINLISLLWETTMRLTTSKRDKNVLDSACV